MSARYAIYAVPGHALRAAGESWLGGIPDGWTRAEADVVTAGRRRYGFHATLKAPFRLAGGGTPAELADRLATFAARRVPVVVPALTLACLDGFFALVAGRETPELRELADEVVREFDDLRAPATATEIARRRPERLDDRGRELLYAWGYPYVLDRFRFHLTLTDPVPEARRAAVETLLRRRFAAFLGHDLVIGSLALFVEPGPARPFVLVSSHPFTKEAP